jgi:hypothetical protein
VVGSERGPKEEDKERRWGCARGVMPESCGRWREAKRWDGRVARGEVAELAHARCSTLARPSEHARVRSVGTIQRAGVIEKAQGGLADASGEVARANELV